MRLDNLSEKHFEAAVFGYMMSHLGKATAIRWTCAGVATGLILAIAGCVPSAGATGKVEKVWGQRGMADGELMKPRAMTIDKDDNLYIVDFTGRVQVFTRDGEYLRGGARRRSSTANRWAWPSTTRATCWSPTRITSAC